MTDQTFSYVGNELEVFAAARRWKRYWASFTDRYLRAGRVLEVGAGIGTNTLALCRHGVDSWTCLEPDAVLVERLRAALQAAPHCGDVVVRCGTLEHLPPAERFDAILYIDVLEHIEDDRAEMAAAAARLSPGGALIVLGPAHQRLFSPFDAAIGHYRRYDRRTLDAAVPAQLRREKLVYLDSVGLLASAANTYLLGHSHPSAAQIQFWDRVLVPLSLGVDAVTRYTIGKSVLGIWRRAA